jgi:hypothetical protein
MSAIGIIRLITPIALDELSRMKERRVALLLLLLKDGFPPEIPLTLLIVQMYRV